MSDQTTLRTKLLLTISSVIVALIAHMPVDAAEIKCDARFSGCNTVTITGVIEDGDYNTFSGILSHHGSNISQVVLNSNGGHALEAIKIGYLVRKNLINTKSFAMFNATPKYFDCLSACSLIWLAGVNREGRVGLHRAYFGDEKHRKMPFDDYSKQYRTVIKMLSEYLEEMEVPQSIVELMLKTGSSEITFVDAVEDQLERPPSYAEWIDGQCSKTHRSPRYAAPTYPKGSLEAQLFSGEDFEKFSCESDLKTGYRRKLTP